MVAQVSEPGPHGFAVSPEVRGTRKQALAGAVEFHLHPTFELALHVVRSHDGVARPAIQACGAFIVGAVALDTMTPLELDLGAVSSAPKRFRKR